MPTFKNRVVPWMAIAVLTTGLAACGGGSEPRDVSFDITVADRAVVGEATTYVANQDDTVTLNIDSDEPGAVHIHGYDVEDETGEDGAVSITFLADATGQFGIEMHVGGHPAEDAPHDEGDGHTHEDEESAISLGVLQIRPR